MGKRATCNMLELSCLLKKRYHKYRSLIGKVTASLQLSLEALVAIETAMLCSNVPTYTTPLKYSFGEEKVQTFKSAEE